MTEAAEPPETVDLAREPDFRLGGLFVSPSTARVRGAAGEQRVEPRVMEVLVVLVRHAGRTVTRDQLIDACWGGRIVSDDAVSRVIAQVRVLTRGGEPAPFVLETVPKIGFRLNVKEASDDGPAEPASAVAPSATALDAERPQRTPRWRTAVAAALFVLALAAVAVWRFPLGGPARPPGQNGRVEVMVFDPATPDPALKQVASGASETLVRLLSGAGVQVAQRPVQRDDASGDAEFRVAGAVAREGEGYVINAQILERRSGLVLWTDRFVRTAREQETSPGDVPFAIAAVLHCALEDRKPSRAAVSTEAFGLYLNTCASVYTDDDEWGRMLATARKLVKAAPQLAGAHAMHSIAAADVAQQFDPGSPDAIALHAESKAAALEALRIDPNTPKAYAALAMNEGVLSGRLDHNHLLEEQYILKALKLDPDLPLTRNQYATVLRSVGRVKEAIAFLRTSDLKDPRSGGDPRIAMLLAATGDQAGAEAVLRKMEVDSGVAQDNMRWQIAFWWGDPKATLSKINALFPADRPKAQRDCAERYLAQLTAAKPATLRGLPDSCATMDRDWRLRMLAREGDVDGAFAALRPPLASGTMLLWHPEMRSVRQDARFWPLAKSFGLTDYWRKSGHWPDFCAEPGLPYECRKMAEAS